MKKREHNTTLTFNVNDEEVKQLTKDLENANEQIQILERQKEILEEKIRNSSVPELEARIRELESTAERAANAYKSALSAVNLATENGFGTEFSFDRLAEIYNEILEGTRTFQSAMTETKLMYQSWFQEVGEGVSGTFDAETVQTFVSSLEKLEPILNRILEIVQRIETEGVKATSIEGTGNNVAGTLDQIKNAADGMDEELKSSYSAITGLVSALTEYANLDPNKLSAVSAAFRNLVTLGHTSFSETKANHIMEFARKLGSISSTGSINFEIKGLDSLKEQSSSINSLVKLIGALKEFEPSKFKELNFDGFKVFDGLDVNSSSLKALSEYLPGIADGSSAKLKNLNNINLSGFNNLKVSKASMFNLAEYLPKIAKANVDRLAKIQSFNFDNFSHIHIERGSVQAVHDLVAAMTSFVAAAQKTSAGGANVEYMLGRIASVATQGRALLANNTEASRYDSYNKLDTALTHLEEILAMCGTDATKLNDVLDQLGYSAPDKINTAVSAMATLRKELQSAGDEGTVTVNKLRDLYKSLSKSYFSASDINNNIVNTSAYKEAEQTLAKTGAALKLVEERGYGLRDALHAVGIDTSNAVQIAQTALSKLNLEITRAKESMKGNAVKLEVDTGDLELKVSNVVQAFDDLKDKSVFGGNLQKNVNDLKALFDIISGNASIEEKNRALKEFNALLAITNRQMKDAAAAEAQEAAIARSREDLIRSTTSLQERLNMMTEKFKESQKNDRNPMWKRLQEDMKAAEDILNRLQNKNIAPVDIDKAKKEFKDLSAEVSTLDKRLSTNKRTLSDYFKTYLSGTRIIMAVVRQIRQMINMAIELDKEMTQLQIVTKASNSTMKEFGGTISDMAQRIAISAKDLISATTTFARLGYTLEESSKLAEITGMLQNVGDIEASAAQNAITAIVKAFDVKIDDIESVADKLVKVGNNFPISVSQIAEGMNNASSALAAAGNTFDESVALLTAANTVVQNAAKASTGLRTIAARLRNTTTELDELGEDMTQAKYEEIVKTLTGLRVSLTDVNGEYRSTYDIMKDIAGVWDTLSSKTQAAITTQIAGVRQQAIFTSLISQFKEASGAMDAMAGSAGELDNAYSIYLDSVEAHINKFKTAFQELSQDVATRELINGVVDLGTKLLDFVKVVISLVDALGGLQVVLPAVVSVFASHQIFKWIDGFVVKLGEARTAGLGFAGALKSLGGIASSIASPIGVASVAIGVFVAAISAYNQAVEKKRQAALEDARTYDESIKKAEDFKQKIADLKGVLEDETTSQEDATRAREDLLDLQNEIEDFYKMEIGSLDLVASKASEAADAIDKETQALANQNLLENYDVYKRAAREIEDSRYIADEGNFIKRLGSTPRDLTLQSAIDRIFDQAGTISLNKGLFGSTVSFEGTAQEIIDDITLINDALNDLANGTYRHDADAQAYIEDIISSLSFGYSEAKSVLDKWQDTYDSLVANTIGADENYAAIKESISLLANGAKEILSAQYTSVEERNAALDAYREKIGDVQKLLDGSYFKHGDERIQRYFQKSIDAVSDGIKAGYDAAWKGIEELESGLEDVASTLSQFSTEPIDELKNSISALKSAFDDLGKDGSVGVAYSNLAKIKEEFASVADIDNYISRLLDVGNNAEAVTEILSELAIAKIESMEGSDDLANADERLVAAMLREIGVVNADEAAHEALSKAKAKVQFDSMKAKDGIEGVIASLSKETAYTDSARKEMARLAAQFIMLNNQNLDLSQQIQQFIALGTAIGYPMAMLQGFANASAPAAKQTVVKPSQMRNGINVTDSGTGTRMTQQDALNLTYKNFLANLNDTFKFDFKSPLDEKTPPGGGGGSVEKYIADIDRFYEALKRVEAIEQRISTLQSKIDTSEDVDERLELTKQLINSYKEEEAAMQELNRQRSEGIQGAISDLQALGFVISYNAETHELLVQNMEHLNELEAGSTEATNELRKETEELIKDLESWNSANQETEASLRGITSNIREAKDAMVSYLEEAVSKANELVDGLQNVYDTLTAAAKEYAETGYLSVDSLQSILALGPKYMAMLVDENGQLVINEQTLQNLIAARTEEMAAETALSYAKQILLATETGEIDTLRQLTQVDIAASNATWDMAYATLALAKAIGTANGIQDSYYDDAFSYIKKMQAVTKTAVDSISAYYETLNDDYISQKDALDQILKMTEDMIKWENDQQVKALEDQKDRYGDIINQKKELIKLAKEQADREKSVQDKLAEIAKLQAKISQLSLDDSREAQAQKSKLEEELAKLQKDLADEQAGYSVDAQTDALDKQLEAYNDEKDKEIEGLQNMLQSAEQLYRAAIERIDSGWNDLYHDLLNWNLNYGNTLEKDLVSAWDAASAAVQRYGGFVAALEGTAGHTGLGGYDDNPPGSESYTNYEGTAQANESIARSIVDRMKANSSKWNGADEAGRNALAAENERLGEELAKLLGANVYRDQNGVWWINGQRLYDLYKYHSGGIVGNAGTKQQDEVMALLQKGEAVLDSQREKGLYKIVDFISVLSDKLGSALDSGVIGRVFGSGAGLPSLINSMTSLATPQLAAAGGYHIDRIEVTAPVYVSEKLSDDDIREHARTIGSISADYIREGFTRRGVRQNASIF